MRNHLEDSAIGVLENSQERLGLLPFRLGCHGGIKQDAYDV